MESLKELDGLTVRVIVENHCDTFSSGASGVEGFQYQSETQCGGPGKGLCMAGHGLSLLLTADRGGTSHTLLLDAGPDPDVWRMNAEKLGIDAGAIEVVALSHYHWDHSGGLPGAVPTIAAARKGLKQPVVVDLQSSAIISRGRPTADGGVKKHKPDNPSAAQLTELGARVEMHDQPHTHCEDFFYVSGFVPRQTEYEKGIPDHVTLVGDKWTPDEGIADERYVACKVKGRGVVVFSSCSHSGIVNVCHHAQHNLKAPLFGVMGGLHLGGARLEGRIPKTVQDLKEVNPGIVIAGHCTGWRAQAQLSVEFKDQFQPMIVGGKYLFSATRA